MASWLHHPATHSLPLDLISAHNTALDPGVMSHCSSLAWVSCHWLRGAWRGISIFTFITFLRRKVNNKMEREQRGTHSNKYLHTWPMKHRVKAMREILLFKLCTFKRFIRFQSADNHIPREGFPFKIWLCQMSAGGDITRVTQPPPPTDCSLQIATPGKWRLEGFVTIRTFAWTQPVPGSPVLAAFCQT